MCHWIKFYIISLTFIAFCSECGCFDPNDVLLAISATDLSGDPTIWKIEGDPDVWGSTFWKGGSLSGTSLTGKPASHLFHKLAFNYWQRKMMWSNAKLGDIEYMPVILAATNGTYTPQNVFEYTSTEIGGVAVDWTTNNIYWTDQIYNWIMMMNMDLASKHHFVITTGLDKPGKIKVNPKLSLLYWTDYGSVPKIESSDLLGNNRKIIVGTDIVKPVAIDIDMVTNMVYWADSDKGSIERCNWDGSNRETLAQDSKLKTVVGLVLYKDYIYLVRSEPSGFLMNISNPTTAKTITHDFLRSYDVDIFGELKQPKLSSPCTTAGCREFCVGKNNNSAYSCACSHGKELVFGTECTGSEYTSGPYYLLSMGKSLCHYSVWTPDLKPSELPDKCFIDFDDSYSRYLGVHYRKHTLYHARDSTIYSIQLKAGAKVNILLLNTRVVKAISVDWISENIYWTDNSGSIHVANSEGYYRRTILKSGCNINGLVVDPLSGYMYWTCQLPDSYISRATMTGDSVTKFVTSSVSEPEHLCIDYLEQRLYWTDSVKDVIESIKLDGTGRRTVITVTGSVPYGIATFQDHVVWTDKSLQNGGVHWGYKDGASLARSMLHTSSDRHVGSVILIGEYSQPAGYTNACSKNNGNCAHLCLPMASGRTCKCRFGQILAADGMNCIIDSTMDQQINTPLLIVDRGHHAFIKMDAFNHKTVSISITDEFEPMGIDFDREDNLLFWTDIGQRRIYKASLDGTNQRLVKSLSTDSKPEGIAVDDTIKVIFYTDPGRHLIISIDYDGNNEKIIVSQNIDKVRAIVLDKQRKKIYWSDWGQVPKIMTATYDGGNQATLVQTTNIIWPNGLTLDLQAQRLYWCDGHLSRIESISTDGTNRQLLTTVTGKQFFDLTLVGDYLYLTDWKSRYLQRIHKSGGSPLETIGNTIFYAPYGIIFMGGNITTQQQLDDITNNKIGNSPNSDSSKGEINITMIIVISICVVGVIIIVTVIAVAVWCFAKKGRKAPNQQNVGMQHLGSAQPPPYNDKIVSRPASGFEDFHTYAYIDTDYTNLAAVGNTRNGEYPTPPPNPYINMAFSSDDTQEDYLHFNNKNGNN